MRSSQFLGRLDISWVWEQHEAQSTLPAHNDYEKGRRKGNQMDYSWLEGCLIMVTSPKEQFIVKRREDTLLDSHFKNPTARIWNIKTSSVSFQKNIASFTLNPSPDVVSKVRPRSCISLAY